MIAVHPWGLKGNSSVICVDIDECRLNTDRCTQLCHNTPGSYSCTCHDGFTLSSNGYTCSPSGRVICAVYTRQNIILSYPSPGVNPQAAHQVLVVLQALIRVIRSAIWYLMASTAAAMQATLLTGMVARVTVSSRVQQPFAWYIHLYYSM
jgi:hypothetical protein